MGARGPWCLVWHAHAMVGGCCPFQAMRHMDPETLEAQFLMPRDAEIRRQVRFLAVSAA